MLTRFLLAAVLLSTAIVRGQDAALTPFLDDQVAAVVRLRPDKIAAETWAELDRKLTPASLRAMDGWKSPLLDAREDLAAWTAAGGGDIYLLISPNDLRTGGPLAVLVPRPGKSAADLLPAAQRLSERWEVGGPGRKVIGGVIVGGGNLKPDRDFESRPTDRSDLLTALNAAPDEAVRIVVSPSNEARRVYRELLPPLPRGLSAATSAELLDGARAVTVHLDLSAEPSFKLSLQTKDAASAQVWKDTVINAAGLLTENESLQKQFPGLQKPAADPAPAVKGDRVEMVWGKDGERLSQLVSEILQPAFQTAYHSAATAESVNDLKQIMLAMHSYHDRHKTFPPRAILSKDGKPLLSWRVLLLPYLDAEALHKEFHLDEPWDSEHNRKLLVKMPPVFASNLLSAANAKAGITPYVTPVGEGTCFGKAEGVAIKDVTDGTSNSIAVVLAIPSAVEWTKPADWEVDFKQPIRGWLREPVATHEALICGFCDGSVHRLPATTPEETVRRLLQIADGNVVELP